MSIPPRSGNDDRETTSALALLRDLEPAINRRDRAKQVEIVRGLVEIKAPMGAQWQKLAYIAASNGEHRMAVRAIDLYVEAFKRAPTTQLQKVGLLTFLGEWDSADAILKALPADVPDPAANAYNRGIAALNLGRTDEARQFLDIATGLWPHSGSAWLLLSMATNFIAEPVLAERLIAAERAMAGAGSQEQVPYYYALGKVYADRDQHSLAFDAYARGARLMNSIANYDFKTDRADAAAATSGYTAEQIAIIANQQCEPTSRTVFVAGLPRSGTTLVEQILTSHSAVSGGGEISRLMLLAREVGGASYPALQEYAASPRNMASAAELWHHWLDELFHSPGRVVDKTVTTSRFMGLAASILPDAPLVWVTRDPLDRAWSCFRTNFAGNAMPWSYDLQNIAMHFRIEDELLARWKDILGERLLIIPYEALVSEPDNWIRRLLAHCGMEEEPQVFAPHENQRAVPTASMVQIRRPINREGVGAAEPYREFLQPFLDAFYR